MTLYTQAITIQSTVCGTVSMLTGVQIHRIHFKCQLDVVVLWENKHYDISDSGRGMSPVTQSQDGP